MIRTYCISPNAEVVTSDSLKYAEQLSPFHCWKLHDKNEISEEDFDRAIERFNYQFEKLKDLGQYFSLLDEHLITSSFRAILDLRRLLKNGRNGASPDSN